MDRKDIALTVGGTLASAAVAFMIYRLQAKDAAQQSAAEQAAAQASAANQDQQSSYLAALPSIQLPASTSSETDTTAASTVLTAPADDPILESLISSFMTNSSTAANTTSVNQLIPVLQSSNVFSNTNPMPVASPIATIGTTSSDVPLGSGIKPILTSTTIQNSGAS